MSLILQGPQTATRLRSTRSIQADGSILHTASSAKQFSCWLEQRTADRTEIVAGAAAESSGWVLTCGPDVDLEAQDQVTVDGVEYEVAGPPWKAHTPRGPHHLEARLRRI